MEERAWVWGLCNTGSARGASSGALQAPRAAADSRQLSPASPAGKARAAGSATVPQLTQACFLAALNPWQVDCYRPCDGDSCCDSEDKTNCVHPSPSPPPPPPPPPTCPKGDWVCTSNT